MGVEMWNLTDFDMLVSISHASDGWRVTRSEKGGLVDFEEEWIPV